MGRVNKIIDAGVDEVESAKETAVALIKDEADFDAIELFYDDNLENIESGIRKLNSFSNKTWLLSSIILYTLIYNKSLYTQSGLSWIDYAQEARTRLGLEPRDITEQLSAARFFIMNHAELERQNFNPAGNNRKLARAEMATELCGDVHETIRHLVNDTWREFNAWYSSFKEAKALPTEYKRDDIVIEKSRVFIGDIEAVSISDKLPEQDRERIEKYVTQIFEAMKQGYEPAIVPVYDEKEARMMFNLRDKYRQGK